MKSVKRKVLVLLSLSVFYGSGCSLEEGLRDGVTDGASAALAAIIEAPVNHILDQMFAEAGG